MSKPSAIEVRHVDLVRRIYEIGEADGLRALAERFDEFCRPDFQWRPRIIGMGKDAYVGSDGFLQYADDMIATVGEPELTLGEIRGVGDHHVLLLGRLHLTGQGSGVPLDSEWAILYSFDGDLLQSGIAFDSHAEAEEAAANA